MGEGAASPPSPTSPSFSNIPYDPAYITRVSGFKASAVQEIVREEAPGGVIRPVGPVGAQMKIGPAAQHFVQNRAVHRPESVQGLPVTGDVLVSSQRPSWVTPSFTVPCRPSERSVRLWGTSPATQSRMTASCLLGLRQIGAC